MKKGTFINQSEEFMSSPRISFWLAPLAASLLMFSSLQARADTSDAVCSGSSDRVFRFNVSPNGYPPYLISKNAQTTGIIWEVVETIAGRLDHTVEAIQVPRKRVDQLLLKGMFDGTTRAIEWTPDPDKFIFTDPIVDIEEVIFFPKDSPADFQVIEDLFSLTLVTHLGYKYPRLEPFFKSGQIGRFDVARDQDMFVYVASGDELDAAVADRLVGQWLLLEHGMQNEFRTSSRTLSQHGFRLMVRRQCQSFAEAFNRELASMRTNGEIDTILSRYR